MQHVHNSPSYHAVFGVPQKTGLIILWLGNQFALVAMAMSMTICKLDVNHGNLLTVAIFVYMLGQCTLVFLVSTSAGVLYSAFDYDSAPFSC